MASYGNFRYERIDSGIKITRYQGSASSVNIPEQIDGVPVTSIGDEAFCCCKSLTSVAIPTSVTSIGDWAFSGCKSLKSVTIPDSVTSIGYSAFSGCKSLTTIYFPHSLKNRFKSFCNEHENKIHYYNFSSNFFTKINRLQNSSNLPDDILKEVKQIETLVLSNRCTTAIFNGTDSILDDFITIQELQQKIETNSVINLITLVNGVSQKKITNVLKYIQTFNDEIAKIKVAAKKKFSALPRKKYAVKRQAPSYKSKDLDKIGNVQFDLTNLMNLELKFTIPSLNGNRTAISSPSKNPVTNTANSAGSQDNMPNEEFSFVSDSAGITISKYKGSADSVNIPSQINGLPVTSISDRAFYGCESLTSVVIPDSVTFIGDWAFSDCESLTSVVIPNSVTSIGVGAFQRCYALTSVVIPDSVTSIGDYAFFYCYKLTSVVIPDSVTSIRVGAFFYCYKLTSIVIPDSVTSIGDRAFNGCRSLTSVVIPDSVTFIGYSAFANCESLTTIYFPYSLVDVNGRDNTLKDFRNEYNDKIRYYNTVSEIKELME